MTSVFWNITRGEERRGSGGGCRSRMMMLLEGREWRRRAVASPMPDDPPVIKVVLRVGDVREERAMVNDSVAILE